MLNNKIIVLDFGNRDNQELVREIRDHGVYCELVDFDKSAQAINEDESIRGVILGKSHGSETFAADQALAEVKVPIAVFAKEDLETFKDLNIQDLKVLDSIDTFIYDVCACERNWDVDNYLKIQGEKIKQQVGDDKVILGLSGGVDSSVVAALLHHLIGDQLTCVFVNHGLMRKYEPESVEEVFKDQFNINLIAVDASDRFLEKLEGVVDPEQKRKIIGNEFIEVFNDTVKELEGVKWLAQGTIYTDVIESGTKAHETIKSHHNVGGLPEDMDLKLLEPLDILFKDEVRELGLALGLPESIVHRQPFPGPGLGVRILGDITREKIRIVQDSDYILREEFAKHGLDKTVWQYFTVLTGLRSTGIKDGKRSYDYTLAIRAVQSVDGMRADWARIPYDVLEIISSRILSEVDGANRLVYDISSKPPSTIEWE